MFPGTVFVFSIPKVMILLSAPNSGVAFARSDRWTSRDHGLCVRGCRSFELRFAVVILCADKSVPRARCGVLYCFWSCPVFCFPLVVHAIDVVPVLFRRLASLFDVPIV